MEFMMPIYPDVSLYVELLELQNLAPSGGGGRIDNHWKP